MTITQDNKKLRRRSSKRSIWKVGSRWISQKMPKSLYARALLIIITPMVILQSVIAFVFMERHWQTVTQRLSQAVTADIAAIVQIVEDAPAGSNFDKIINLAQDTLSLNVALLEPEPFPPAVGKPFFSLLDDTLRTEITEQIGRPFWIDTVGDSNILEIRIRLENQPNVLRVFVRRNQAYASNSHIFLIWMVGTSLVLLLIAILFLRNQIRPIQQLSYAADSFGKGHVMPEDFKIRGASEVRQAGLAFLQMRERIERQIEQRTAMLTGVSHDLRTILTRFKLQLALIGETNEIKELEADVDDMKQMLEGYINFAKGDADEPIQEINIMQALERHSIEANVLKKDYDVECSPNVTLKVRPNAFHRMVANLVSNAMRYANTLNIKVVEGTSRLTITFDDDGPGIEENMREEVFKPFLRLDEARNLDESGTGLGLSIARDIARNHGGDINLYESSEGGLRVIVVLPL